jgi:hypothetical protein
MRGRGLHVFIVGREKAPLHPFANESSPYGVRSSAHQARAMPLSAGIA